MFIRRRHAVAPGTAQMRPACKSAAEALAEGPLAGLVDQARLLGRISSVVAEISREAVSSTHSLPPLRCALHDRTVIITVGAPSHAAKLRQRAAALEQALRERVPEVTGIRIRLQPGSSADPISGSSSPGSSSESSRTPESRESLSAALRFADELSRDLHDSPLRRSAQRLQALLRARLDSGK
jgi:hypothetical protein